MDYFLGHIGYVIIAAVIIAGVAFLSVYVGNKNEEGKDQKEKNPNEGCGGSCIGCGSFSDCDKEDKKYK